MALVVGTEEVVVFTASVTLDVAIRDLLPVSIVEAGQSLAFALAIAYGNVGRGDPFI